MLWNVHNFNPTTESHRPEWKLHFHHSKFPFQPTHNDQLAHNEPGQHLYYTDVKYAPEAQAHVFTKVAESERDLWVGLGISGWA